MPKELSIKAYDDDLTKGKGPRLYSTKIAKQVLEDDWDPRGDPTLEQWIEEKKEEEKRKKGMNTKAPVFVPGTHKIRAKARKSMRKSRKTSRKSRKTSRKSRKVSRKSRKVSRKSRKVSRKSRKVSRKSRKVSRKSRKVSRKSRKASRRSLRSKSRRVSRRKSMGKRERACKDLLKEKVGINLKEYEDGRYVSRQQAIAVAYSQVKKMKPSCGKYFKRKDL